MIPILGTAPSCQSQRRPWQPGFRGPKLLLEERFQNKGCSTPVLVLLRVNVEKFEIGVRGRHVNEITKVVKAISQNPIVRWALYSG
jgi:hypothetical protein